MTTSGTYTQTIKTSTMLEHAIRRCGKNPASLTSETVQIAKINLYLLLLSLASEGLNLWAVQRPLIGLTEKKATYLLPSGTLDLLSVTYSMPTRATGTDTAGAQSLTTALDSETEIVRVGLKFSVISTAETITLEYSDDGLTWNPISTLTKTDWATDEWYWVALDPTISSLNFRVTSTTNPITLTEFYLASQISDLPLYPFNRDDYTNQVNKFILGRPCTNYYFEKLINPQLTLWVVPNNNYDHLNPLIHRQVEDIGSLTQEVAIPNRWKESIIWQLARNLCFELPDIPDSRIQLVMGEAERTFLQVEKDETDSAPLRIAPDIGRYNR